MRPARSQWVRLPGVSLLGRRWPQTLHIPGSRKRGLEGQEEFGYMEGREVGFPSRGGWIGVGGKLEQVRTGDV